VWSTVHEWKWTRLKRAFEIHSFFSSFLTEQVSYSHTGWPYFLWWAQLQILFSSGNCSAHLQNIHPRLVQAHLQSKKDQAPAIPVRVMLTSTQMSTLAKSTLYWKERSGAVFVLKLWKDKEREVVTWHWAPRTRRLSSTKFLERKQKERVCTVYTKLASSLERVITVHCLTVLDLGAGVSQPIDLRAEIEQLI